MVLLRSLYNVSNNNRGCYSPRATITESFTSLNHFHCDELISIDKIIPFDVASKYIQEDEVNGTVISGSLVKLQSASSNTILNPFEFTVIGSEEYGDVGTTKIPIKIKPSGNYTYTAHSNQGNQDIGAISIFNTSDLNNPTFIGEFKDSKISIIKSFDISGNYIYVVAATTTGLNPICSLVGIDVSNPQAPIESSNMSLGYNAMDIEIVGNYAYVTCMGVWLSSGGYQVGSLRIIDISDPSLPVEVTTYTLTTTNGRTPNRITVHNDIAYISDFYFSRLFRVDVSNILSPVLMNGISAERYNYIYVSGDYLYGIRYNAFDIIDISDPVTMSKIKSGSLEYSSTGYYYSDSLYCLGSKLEVVNVQNPASADIVGTYDISGNVISIVNNYAYTLSGANTTANGTFNIIDLNHQVIVYDYTTTKPYYVTTSDLSNINISSKLKIKSTNIIETLPTSTMIKGLISFDGRVTWLRWNGSVWEEHIGGLDNLQTGNTVAQIETGLTNRSVSSYNTLDFAFDLSTTDENFTPVIDDIVITYV